MMFSNIEEDSFFNQKIKIKMKFSNKELSLLRFFNNKTKFYPETIIVFKDFIFFFVRDSNEYLIAKSNLNYLRKQLQAKILIVRAEKILKRLLFSFFSDPYIHDLKLDINKLSGLRTITVYFIFFKDRGIAIGRNGDYIKAVNEIFEKYIIFEEKIAPVKIKCSLISLIYQGTSFKPIT